MDDFVFSFQFVFDKDLLCSPGCPGTRCIGQAALELTEISFASSSWVIRLKVVPCLDFFFFLDKKF